MNIEIGRSKSGLPTLTESGGRATNTGDSQIIAGPQGERLKPLFVPRGYANGDHAIFVLRPGMHVVQAQHSRDGECTIVYRVTAILADAAEVKKVYEWENGDGNIPEFLNDAVAAAKQKAHCYHCRDAHYVL